MKQFEYICFGRMEDKPHIDVFTLFEDILKQDEEEISYHRYARFGKVDCGIATTSKTEFFEYYEPLTNELYKECCAKEQKNDRN